MGPLLNAASVYVVVIVRTQDRDKIVVADVSSEVEKRPDDCEDISGKVG